MTKNGPIPKTKTDSESGECTDHLSTLQNSAHLQSPVKNHPTMTHGSDGSKRNNGFSYRHILPFQLQKIATATTRLMSFCAGSRF